MAKRIPQDSETTGWIGFLFITIHHHYTTVVKVLLPETVFNETQKLGIKFFGGKSEWRRRWPLVFSFYSSNKVLLFITIGLRIRGVN